MISQINKTVVFINNSSTNHTSNHRQFIFTQDTLYIPIDFNLNVLNSERSIKWLPLSGL